MIANEEPPSPSNPASSSPPSQSRTSRLSLLEQLERLDGKWLGATEQSSIWMRMQRNFAIQYDTKHPNIQKYVNRYARYPAHIQQVSYRSTPYLHYIVDEVEKRSMPAEIALLPMIESAFDPFAHSHQGAAGIWQMMSTTGKRFGLQQDWWYDGRRDIVASTQAALDYLQYLHDMFDNDWLLALAAYNAGEGTVKRAVEKSAKKNGGRIDFFSLELPAETKEYVPKLLALATIVRTPQHYKIDLPPIDNEPYLEMVKIDSQIDLAYAAELAEIDLKLLYRLNPGFSRWATHPNGPQDLLLPNDKAKQFRSRLAQADTKSLVQWQRYQVQAGDTLGDIANLYKTTTDELRYINHLKTASVAPGSYLLIPTSNGSGNKMVQTAAKKSRAIGKTTPVVHVVKQGDSLWSISQRYQVSVQRLMAWNQLSSKSTLKPGQQLLVKS